MILTRAPRLFRKVRESTAVLVALVAWAIAGDAVAGDQARRAIEAVRQLATTGQVPGDAVLRLGFKQGNVDAFLGTDLELQREWERDTGIRLEARVIPQQSALQTLGAMPLFDLTVARNHELPDLVAGDLIEDLTPHFKRHGFAIDDARPDGFLRPDLQAFVGDRTFAIPADGDVAILYLRRDLLDDEAEQAAFLAAHGRPLAAPETWQEYEALVRFFHRPEQGLFGAVEERDTEGAWMYWLPRFLSQAVPHADLFDAQMRPLIDSPAGIAATESYAAVVPYSPPGITDDGNSYNFTLPLFAQGRAFATISTIAGARLFNSAASSVRGRFVAVPMPGTRVGERIVRANTVIYGNNLVVPKGPNAGLAFLFAMWLTDPDVSARSVGVPGGFADPYRWNHLSDPRIRSVYSVQALQVFADEWEVAHLPGTGLPGDAEYLAVLDRELTAVARGERAPAEAMARTAAEWDEITERLGRAEQIRRRHDWHRDQPGPLAQ